MSGSVERPKPALVYEQPDRDGEEAEGSDDCDPYRRRISLSVLFHLPSADATTVYERPA